MKLTAVKVQVEPIRYERINVCKAYSYLCTCYNECEATECSLGLRQPLDYDENKINPGGLCPIVQSIN